MEQRQYGVELYRVVGALTALLISFCTIAAAQDQTADSSKVSSSSDSLAVLPLSSSVDSTLKIMRPRFPSINDSLIRMIFAGFDGSSQFPDRPQSSSRWQSDPELYRLGVSMWGDLETFYPLGLTPSHLSRADNFVGEQTFANPVPLPYSEEWLRSEPSQRSYFLRTALNGLVLPFGRSTGVYQQSDLVEFDTATSSVYVNRGRGGFANTTFDFASNFGSFGSIRADGTFQKNDGLLSGADSKLNRMRVMVEPRLKNNLQGRVLYSFNRLRGNRMFFPTDYQFDGNVSDNFATLSTSLTYLRSEDSQLDLRLTYRNDDQRFESSKLRTAMRFRVVESQLEYQKRHGQSTTAFVATTRYLNYHSQGVGTSSIYFDAGLRRLGKLSPRVSYFGAASLTGSDELSPAPNLLATAMYQLSSQTDAILIGGWRSIQPQPEMLFHEPVQAAFADTVYDFALQSDSDLGIGTARSLELVINHRRQNLRLQLQGGIINMSNVAEWKPDYSSLTYGRYRALELDNTILFGVIKAKLEPFNGVTTNVAYAIRSVTSDGEDVAFGPMHTASASAWYHFPINRLKIWLNIGAGATFRSAVNRYLAGGVEDGVFVTESYLSFDLKRFHFYFNYHNLLDVSYTLNNIKQPGRSVWWGFKWTFVD